MKQVNMRGFDALYKRVRSKGRRWRSITGLCVLTLIMSLLVNACSLNQAPQLQPLKIGITTWPGFDVVLYAKAADLFKKHGLNVELIRFENQQDSSRAVIRGALDAAFVSLWDVVQVDPGNDKPAVVMVTNISHGADGIVTQANIKSVEELRGKRVGAKLGTVNHLILLEALKLHHVKPEEVTIEDISNESAVELMEKGKLDGAVVWEPLLGTTAKKIKGHIVYTTKEINSLVIDTLMSRATAVTAKKSEFTQFASTWLDVMHAVDVEPNVVYEQVGKQIGQSGASFGSDYAGLKKGDISLQQRMFQSQDGLKQAIVKMAQLLKEDPRAGRAPREDIEIDATPVTAAIEGWKS
ncbi:MAG: ABC transporter substrate-binding protein [Leptolyngbya sp. BL-A-14]